MQHARRDALALGLDGHSVPTEAVRKDIVGNAFPKPGGRPVRRIVDRELIFVPQGVQNLAAAAIAAHGVHRTVRAVYREVVPVQPRVIGRERRAVPVPRASQPIPAHRERFRLTAILLDPQCHILDAALAPGINRKLDRFPCLYRAVGLLAGKLTGVEHTIGNGFQKQFPQT